MEYKLKRTNDSGHDLDIEGLLPGAEIGKYFPDLMEKPVRIFPGLYHSCRDDRSFWAGILARLYDLWQTDMGANLKKGDVLVYEPKGWRFEVVDIHVVPVSGTFPGEWDMPYPEED